MAVYSIDANELKKMFLAGAANLESKKEWINELNVFPVPDGDTGTNMTMTILSAAKEVQNLTTINMTTLGKAMSSGSLRGARGNSGVILSQLLRGFCKDIADKEVLTAADIASAMNRATETAYKAVMKPKEGTILTVARGLTEKAKEIAGEEAELGEFFEAVLTYGKEVLERTPEMLPVLKQAGVVDSGGQGLIQFLTGALDEFAGRSAGDSSQFGAPEAPAEEKPAEEKSSEEKPAGKGAAFDEGEIRFGYCTEFIINASREFTNRDELDFKAYLETLGDCIVVVADDDIVKVHVHTNDPGLAIQKALTYGSLSRIKIDNMREEHEERLFTAAESEAADQGADLEETPEENIPSKPFGFIAVSIGEGMNEIFRGLNVDYLIEGGQTMNPSTEDMLNAIEKVHADTIFILPNNGNIILAAEQAKTLTEDKNIIVVPTKTVPQGVTAVISFNADADAEENLETMKEAISHVKTGEVTYAVRNTSVDDKEIHEGDIMGIGDHTILSVGSDIAEVTLDMASQLVDGEAELLSIYYGSDITEETAQELCDTLTEKYPDLDVELYNGGQPIYYYVLSVE